MHEPFAELALLLLIAAVVGALAVRLRQPMLIAYIVVGIAVGPAGWALVQAHDQIPAAILALFVLIGNPLIVLAIMGYMGYRKRTGFLAGLTVAQISEFSICRRPRRPNDH